MMPPPLRRLSSPSFLPRLSLWPHHAHSPYQPVNPAPAWPRSSRGLLTRCPPVALRLPLAPRPGPTAPLQFLPLPLLPPLLPPSIPWPHHSSRTWPRFDRARVCSWVRRYSHGQTPLRLSLEPHPAAPPSPPSPPPPSATHSQSSLQSSSSSSTVSKYLPHLPNLAQRPTKEELLAAASGFWQRSRIRFKWVSIRSMRPWNADEWGAFVSWFMLGHIVWFLVGTTTFMSLVILSINTVFAQETLARWIGDYLTQSAGLTIIFESAIVPKWRNGVISFRNVFVSRRPGQITSSVSKGSSTNAAAVAAAGRQSDPAATEVVDDGNYTQFDLTLATVNVTLSLLKWWAGKGLLQDVEIQGVRGVVDRTSVRSSPDDNPDPYSYRHRHQPGDFEMESFKLQDLQVMVYQPNGFRPFPVSLYSCELPQLRKRWLFYDLLSANHMSGSFDGSLFTIHPRQMYPSSTSVSSSSSFFSSPVPSTSPPSTSLFSSITLLPPTMMHEPSANAGEEEARPPSSQQPGGPWEKLSRLRIDGLRIDHLNRGVEGPFGWIYEGNVDIIADVLLPAPVDDGIGRVVADVFDQLEDMVTVNRGRILQYASSPSSVSNHHVPQLTRTTTMTVSAPNSPSPAPHPPDPPPPPAPVPPATLAPASPAAAPSCDHTTALADRGGDDDRQYLIMDLRMHLNTVRAAVPLFAPHMSYVNQALVRPIVAYINAKQTYIPMSCRIVKRLGDFDGAWTVFDCGLMADLSAQAYEAFSRDVENQQSRGRRLRKVGFWTLSMAVQAIFMGMAGNVL